MAATKAATKAVEASDVVEDVKELAEDTVELVEDTASWVSRNAGLTALLAGCVGAALGAGVTYFIVKKKLEEKIQAEADAQIEDVKNHYSVLRKDGPSLEERAEQYTDSERAAAEEVIDEQGYTSYDRVPTVVEPPATAAQIVEIMNEEEPELIVRNVFESDNPDTYFDPEEEAERRATKPNEPFVITADEFNENETDYEQQCLTYYDGDDVLADQQDQPIPEIDKVIGYENLLRFGHGSGDPMLVFIRNNKLEVDFEVTHSDGKFAKEVLGFDDELKHEDKRPKKFRPRHE